MAAGDELYPPASTVSELYPPAAGPGRARRDEIFPPASTSDESLEGPDEFLDAAGVVRARISVDSMSEQRPVPKRPRISDRAILRFPPQPTCCGGSASGSACASTNASTEQASHQAQEAAGTGAHPFQTASSPEEFVSETIRFGNSSIEEDNSNSHLHPMTLLQDHGSVTYTGVSPEDAGDIAFYNNFEGAVRGAAGGGGPGRSITGAAPRGAGGRAVAGNSGDRRVRTPHTPGNMISPLFGNPNPLTIRTPLLPTPLEDQEGLFLDNGDRFLEEGLSCSLFPAGAARVSANGGVHQRGSLLNYHLPAPAAARGSMLGQHDRPAPLLTPGGVHCLTPGGGVQQVFTPVSQQQHDQSQHRQAAARAASSLFACGRPAAEEEEHGVVSGRRASDLAARNLVFHVPAFGGARHSGPQQAADDEEDHDGRKKSGDSGKWDRADPDRRDRSCYSFADPFSSSIGGQSNARHSRSSAFESAISSSRDLQLPVGHRRASPGGGPGGGAGGGLFGARAHAGNKSPSEQSPWGSSLRSRAFAYRPSPYCAPQRSAVEMLLQGFSVPPELQPNTLPETIPEDEVLISPLTEEESGPTGLYANWPVRADKYTM
eukprot:g7836.t1